MDNENNQSELEKNFPRIAERIVQLWNSFELSSYLDEIMIDDRGTRLGFPPDVASEILFLRIMHDAHMLTTEGAPTAGNVWSHPFYAKPVGHDGAD
jgi:uncharacterized protein